MDSGSVLNALGELNFDPRYLGIDDLRCEGDWTRLFGGAGDGVRLEGDVTRTTGRPGVWQGSCRVKKFSSVSHPPPTRTIMCVPFNSF